MAGPLKSENPFSGEQQLAFDAGLQKILARYPEQHKHAAMIPVLRLCQDILGHITPAAMELAAHKLEVHPARAEEVATFYSMLHTEPRGKYLVELCTNVSCCLRGAETLLAQLETRLGIKPGQTTSDKKITLREVECLASCGTAPVMQIDEEFVENLTPGKLDKILDSLK